MAFSFLVSPRTPLEGMGSRSLIGIDGNRAQAQARGNVVGEYKFVADCNCSPDECRASLFQELLQLQTRVLLLLNRTRKYFGHLRV